jgi:hypothetical protein
MTWFIILPKDNSSLEAAVRQSWVDENVRSNDMKPDEADEVIGTFQLEDDPGTRMIAGSSRITDAQVDNIVAIYDTQIEFVEEWPTDWVYPEQNA